MYTGYATTAALALRAKRSFALNHIRVSDDDSSCGTGRYHGSVASAGDLVSPRVSVLLYDYYHWRHSAFVRCVLPSRRIVSVSNGYCRGFSPCSACCCSCCCGNGGVDAGRFHETLGLLAGAGGGGGMGGEIEVIQVGKFGSCYATGGRGRRGYDAGRRGMRKLGSNCWSELATEEEFRDKEDYGRWVGEDEGFSRVRRSGEDCARERRLGLSSRFRSSYSGEKETMGSRKEAESKIRGKGRISSSVSTSSYQARSEERDRVEQRKSREELQRISNTSAAVRESNGVDVSDTKVENKEEGSELAVKLLDEVRRQRSEIDELNKNYHALLLKRSEEDRVASVRAAASSNTLSSRLEGSEQISTAILSLVDELKKQRVEIDRLLSSHQELTTTSKIHETDNVRISHPNKAFVSRLEDREESTTSTLNLIEEDGERHCLAEQLKGEHHVVAQSPQKRESIVQKVSGANSSSVLELNNQNKSSTSVASSVDKIKEKYSYSDLSTRDYERFTEPARVHKINSNRVSTSNKVAITGSRGREQSSFLDANLVEGRRESSLSMVSDTGLECKDQSSALETNIVEERKASTSDKIDITCSRSREQSSTIDDDKRVYMSDKVTFTSFQGREQSSTLDVDVVNDRRESMPNKFSLTGFQGREKSSTLDANLVDERRESTSNKVSSTKFQGREKGSCFDADLVEDRRVSTSNKVAFTKLQGREKSSSIDASLVEDRRASTSNKVAITRSQGLEQSSTTDASFIDGRRASTSDKVTMTCFGGGEQSSIVDSSLLGKRRQHQNSLVQVRMDNNMLMQTSKMLDADTERASSSEESISRSRYEEKNSDLAVDLFGERSEQLGVIDQFKEDEYNLSKSAGAQKGDIDCLLSSSASNPNRSSISKSNDVEKGSISDVSMIREGKERHYYAYQETVGSDKMADLSEVEGRIITSPSLSGIESENAEKSSSMVVQEAVARPEVCLFQKGKISDGISGAAYQDVGQLHERGVMNEQVSIEHDMLESALQFDNSSSLYVGEIVDKLREMLDLDESNAMPKYSSGANIETTLLGDGQMGYGSQLGVVGASEEDKIETVLYEEPGQTLASSEEKGPSDELWGLTDPSSSMAPSKKEKPEKEVSEVASGFTTMPATSQTAVVRRSGRSMWSFILNLIQMGWITRAKYQKSTVQSSTQSTSNESVSNDAWFSSVEPDKEDDHTKKGRKEALKESLLSESSISQKLSGIEVLGQEAEVTPENRLAKEDAGRSEFFGTTGRNDVSLDSSTISTFQTPTSGGKVEVGISADTTEDVLPSIVVDSSSLPMTHLGITGTHTRDMHEIEFTKHKEPLGENITGITETEVKDSDLRKRKFQRNKQIPREKIDEWEEAHKLEMEQRKVDEFFMSEALKEAKKAAEIWEVPIGAVLVQNGNVIARGKNLVEELRDSTAHAEMICIREASNLLRTWRLSDTTLYVTLEPCPMCAGAILQARVDTVVWGAPNKLLGADGSWVRLFPGGEGKDDLGESSQSAGPVHPFHPKIKIRRGILATECSEVMQQFFQLRRKKDKKKEDAESPRLSISSYPNKLFTRMHGFFNMMFCL